MHLLYIFFQTRSKCDILLYTKKKNHYHYKKKKFFQRYTVCSLMQDVMVSCFYALATAGYLQFCIRTQNR